MYLFSCFVLYLLYKIFIFVCQSVFEVYINYIMMILYLG